MSDEDFGAMSDVKPKSAGPVLQEHKKGHALLRLGSDVFAEVSKFHGKVYASLRKWFQADDGVWYRTKNGLNVPVDVMLVLLNQRKELEAFIEAEKIDPWESRD